MTGVAASDAERAVLGSALLNNALFPEVCAQLQVGDFQDPRHREALGALKLLWEAGQPLDYVTLVAKLRETHRLPKAGGHAYITQLADDVSSKNLNPYIRAVLNASHRRRLSEAVNNGHAGLTPVRCVTRPQRRASVSSDGAIR